MSDHRWFHPYRGSNLRCRSCGLWHGAYDGSACPGERDWPQPDVHLVYWEPPEVVRPGAEFTARLRCVEVHGNQLDVVVDVVVDAPPWKTPNAPPATTPTGAGNDLQNGNSPPAG